MHGRERRSGLLEMTLIRIAEKMGRVGAGERGTARREGGGGESGTERMV